MAILLLGLLLFLGVHSIRILADGWRGAMVARLGLQRWKGLYSLLSIAGFVLLIVGWGRAKAGAVSLWSPPAWTAHLGALLTAVAFVLVTAAYVRGNQIQAALHHPMVLGVQVWAVAHLLANGTQLHLVLFGSFLVWAFLSYLAARRRDRALGTAYPPGALPRTLLTVAVGLGLWALFTFYLHERWIGAAPLG